MSEVKQRHNKEGMSLLVALKWECHNREGYALPCHIRKGESLWALFKIGLLPMLVNFKIVIF